MRRVVDNSVLVAWVLDGQSTYADAVGGLLATGQAIVPPIWPLEFANVLRMAERRGRISEAEVRRVRHHALSLPIVVVADHAPRVMTEVLALARQQALTVYDAVVRASYVPDDSTNRWWASRRSATCRP